MTVRVIGKATMAPVSPAPATVNQGLPLNNRLATMPTSHGAITTATVVSPWAALRSARNTRTAGGGSRRRSRLPESASASCSPSRTRLAGALARH